jgi:hypothetical protein
LQQWRDVYDQLVHQHLPKTNTVSDQFSAQPREENQWAALEQRIAQLELVNQQQQTSITQLEAANQQQQTRITQLELVNQQQQTSINNMELWNLEVSSAWREQQLANIELLNRLDEMRDEQNRLRRLLQVNLLI